MEQNSLQMTTTCMSVWLLRGVNLNQSSSGVCSSTCALQRRAELTCVDVWHMEAAELVGRFFFLQVTWSNIRWIVLLYNCTSQENYPSNEVVAVFLAYKRVWRHEAVNFD